MTNEEIKLCQEIGEIIQFKVYEFYTSKRCIESFVPNEEIRKFLERYKEDYVRLARLYELENAILPLDRGY